jgi:hypothetical protein
MPLSKDWAGPGPTARPTSDPKQDPAKGSAKKTQPAWNQGGSTPSRPTPDDKPKVPGRKA